MSALNKGVSGAKRATYSGASPRELLVHVVEECRENAHEDAIYREFEKALLSDERMRCAKAILRWWFDNNYRTLREQRMAVMPQRAKLSVVGSPPRLSPDRAKVEREAATLKVVDTMRANLAKIALREMLMPNGKKLKDNTFGEVRKLSPVLGDFTARVGARGKKDEIVGRVLSEVDLQSIYTESAS